MDRVTRSKKRVEDNKSQISLQTRTVQRSDKPSQPTRRSNRRLRHHASALTVHEENSPTPADVEVSPPPLEPPVEDRGSQTLTTVETLTDSSASATVEGSPPSPVSPVEDPESSASAPVEGSTPPPVSSVENQESQTVTTVETLTDSSASAPVEGSPEGLESQTPNSGSTLPHNTSVHTGSSSVDKNFHRNSTSFPRIDFSKVPIKNTITPEIAAAAADVMRRQRAEVPSPTPPLSPSTVSYSVANPEQLFDNDDTVLEVVNDVPSTQHRNKGKKKQVIFESSSEDDDNATDLGYSETATVHDEQEKQHKKKAVKTQLAKSYSASSKPGASALSSMKPLAAGNSDSSYSTKVRPGSSDAKRGRPKKTSSSAAGRKSVTSRGKAKKKTGKSEAQTNHNAASDQEEAEESECDYINDPDDPAYEPDAEDYPRKAGPIPNDCLATLDKAMYEFMTEVYSLGRRYGKRPQELLDACGYNYTSKRSDSTWNCFQAYKCIVEGWEKEAYGKYHFMIDWIFCLTFADFVQHLSKAYESELKSKLKHEWQRVDLRRVVMRRYVDWYQTTRQEQMDKVKRSRGVTLREINKVIKECQKLGRVAYDAYDLIIHTEVHDLNNSNHSKFAGYSPEYNLVMQTQQAAWSEQLKYHAAQFVVARGELWNADIEHEDPLAVEIKSLYQNKRQDLGSLRKMVSKVFAYDIKLATEGAHSRMHWMDWNKFSYANHLRLIDWPAGLPILGRRTDGHIDHSKRLSKPLLQGMMDARIAYWNALAKKAEDQTEEEEELIVAEYMGPRIMSWTDEEEKKTPKTEGDLPLIIDENDDVLLMVKDVLRDSLDDENGECSEEESTDDENNDNNNNNNNDNEGEASVQDQDSDNDETIAPKAAKRSGLSVRSTVPPPSLNHRKERDDRSKPSKPSKSTTVPVAGPSRQAIPSKSTSTTKNDRFIANAGAIVSNFVEAHRNANHSNPLPHQAGTSKGKPKAVDDEEEDVDKDKGVAKKKKKLVESNRPPNGSYSRLDLKRIHRK
ncbi:hypothetical protein K435DRAFT_795231 [Dendrothele bispora CBS 962.96]|uniref:Uncharacterized protein n=1 Tax=Dendrothele bispora (strain CBS 962.96) TaxID=1314807 RepID=A0A4S8MA00_DENBC|nr:hypothetical protein K435DRAFT_795231 [Dendrothele bispora CBS 962.96]